MANTKAIVYKDIGKISQFFCKAVIVLFFFRIEPDIFEQNNLIFVLDCNVLFLRAEVVNKLNRIMRQI